MPQFTDECLDPGFGWENSDGYVRVLDKPRKVGGRLVMRHRWFWELANGAIPDGRELDHLCKNRRCCNHNHLRLITRSDHAITTNKERYIEDRKTGLLLFELGHTVSEIADKVGRTETTIKNWINLNRRLDNGN